MPSQSRASVRQAWADRVDRFQQSNQTVAEFCHAEGISPASLYQWRKKLRRDDAAVIRPVPAFVPVKLPAPHASSPTTVMSVELPGGVRVRIEVTQACQADS